MPVRIPGDSLGFATWHLGTGTVFIRQNPSASGAISWSTMSILNYSTLSYVLEWLGSVGDKPSQTLELDLKPT